MDLWVLRPLSVLSVLSLLFDLFVQSTPSILLDLYSLGYLVQLDLLLLFQQEIRWDLYCL
jgi:hypothetical protein